MNILYYIWSVRVEESSLCEYLRGCQSNNSTTGRRPDWFLLLHYYLGWADQVIWADGRGKYISIYFII